MSKREISRKIVALFGDPIRMEIFEHLLQNKEKGDFTGNIAKILFGENITGAHISKVSSHIAVLKSYNILTWEKENKLTYYKINPEVMEKGKIKIHNFYIEIK